MSVSPGLSKDTVDNIVWLPSGDVDSPFLDRDPGVKRFIPPQKTPDTDLNESNETSFTSSSPSSVGVPIPSNIYLAQDFPSPYSEQEPEETSTWLEQPTIIDTLTQPSSMDVYDDKNNNKRKASVLNAIAPKLTAPPLRVYGDLMYLRLELCHLTPQQQIEYKLLEKKISNKFGELPCRNCNRMSCKDKINIRYVMGIAKLTGFIRPDSVYDDNWTEVSNNKQFRLQMHQFYCLSLGKKMSETPPSACLEVDLVSLFPSPKDLPANHHLWQAKNVPSKWLQNHYSTNMSKRLYLVEAKKIEDVTEREIQACIDA